jgi:hypothetical protein
MPSWMLKGEVYLYFYHFNIILPSTFGSSAGLLHVFIANFVLIYGFSHTFYMSVSPRPLQFSLS